MTHDKALLAALLAAGALIAGSASAKSVGSGPAALSGARLKADAARAAALEKDPALKPFFNQQLTPTLMRGLQGGMDDCLRRYSADPKPTFRFTLEIVGDGRVVAVGVDHPSAWSPCVVAPIVAQRYPSPPVSHFVISDEIDMHPLAPGEQPPIPPGATELKASPPPG